jgi:hypothetical protein
MMYRWTSVDGLDWQGPDELPRFGTNLEPSYPSAIAVKDVVHVFAIGHGGPFASGGPLVRWSSRDGVTFGQPVQDNPPGWAIPGESNASPSARRTQ